MTDVPETRFTRTSRDTHVAYQVTGEGPRNLLFMGVLPVELMWDDPGFTRMARRLGNFSRTIWVNPTGWGGSEDTTLGSYLGEDANVDLVAVLDAVGVEAAAFVATSFIGSRLIDFAVTHAKRVNACVFINSCAYYVREDDYPWGIPPESLDRFVSSLEEVWRTGDDLKITGPSRMGDERFQEWWTRTRRASVGPRFLSGALRERLQEDARPLLASVAVPTLVLHREGDRLVHLGAGRYLAEHIPGAKFVVLPGDDHSYYLGDTDALVDEIEEFLTGSRSGADSNVLSATVLFTDIVGSTEQQARLGPSAWSRLTDEHDAMIRDALAHHHGREIKTTGDGFLATFDATGRALRCAAEIVAKAKVTGLDVRAGVHIGDVEVRGGDIAGLPVSIARRICDLAGPGEVLSSEAIRLLMVGSGFGFNERGAHELKGVPGSWRLYRVVS